MKRLVLMRHAKAEHYSTGSDHERSLTGRGQTDAAAAGLILARLGLQKAIVSTSARTRETFAALGIDAEPEFADWLYFGGTDTLRARIADVPETVTGLIVVGHAPTIPGLAADLAAEADHDEADEVGGWFPTSAFAEFTFDGTWADLADGLVRTSLVQVRR